MKRFSIVVLFFLTTFYSTAQDCSDFVMEAYDKMEQRNIISSKETLTIVKPDGSGGIGFYAVESKDQKALIIKFKAVGMLSDCIDEMAPIDILFTNGEKITWRSGRGFNCDAEAFVWARNLKGWKKEIKQITENTIESIRVTGRKSYMQVDLTTEEANVISQTLACLWKFGY